jgi:hypothetical protein
MENSGNILFSDDRAQWYLAVGEKPIGPFSASEVYEKILAQEITWAHFAWRQGEAQWNRLCDLPSFQAAVPRKPSQAPEVPQPQPVAHAKPAAKEAKGAQTRQAALRSGARATAAATAPLAPESRIWFLYYNQTQFGPFSREEIGRFIMVGKIHARVHAWRYGMANWARLEKISEFASSLSSAALIPEIRSIVKTRKMPSGAPADVAQEEPSVRMEHGHEKRAAPRAPLLARILVSDDREVSVGVCRDISVGGMQVLTDSIPAEVGKRIRLNVSSTGVDGQKGQDARAKIDPFVAEGVVVRLLEDRRGFSFRFDKLSSSAKRAIERYLGSAS